MNGKIELTRGYYLNVDTGMLCAKGSFPVEPHANNLLKREWLPLVKDWLKSVDKQVPPSRRTEIERIVKIWMR